jgi:magnesium transporter
VIQCGFSGSPLCRYCMMCAETCTRALESILVATANALEEEMTFTRQLVQQLLADLEDDINRDNLKRLLHYSRRIVGFQSRARYVKRAVDEILDNGSSAGDA